MRMVLGSLGLSSALTLGLFIPGCGSPTTSKEPPSGQTEHFEGDGHDHSEDAAAHPTEGPHGGHLIELGDEEYHAELLHNDSTHTVTVHLLDGPAKQAVAIPEKEITLQLFQNGQFAKHVLTAVSATADPVGTSSCFQAVDAALCGELRDEEEVRGRLQVTIDGKPYTGSLEHMGHDHP